VQYLRILIKASLWAKKNYEEVVKIFAKGSWQDDEEAERKARIKDFNSHLAPKFSDKLISALKEEKDFLLENKFIQKDFSIDEWIDESFLESAWKEEKQLVNIG
jgi:ABC-type nitrate/sulfonate/bicarbonate transport system substrate-binding protein